MPIANHCLAIKQAAIDDWEKKLVAKHSALQDIMQAHDNNVQSKWADAQDNR